MERHAPDPRGQALVEYMIKGVMEAYDATAGIDGHEGARKTFEAAARERMAQVACTVTIGYQAIAELALERGALAVLAREYPPSVKGILEEALGPVDE